MSTETNALKSRIFIHSGAQITSIVAPLEAAGKNVHGEKAFSNFLRRQRVYYALASFIK